MSGSPFVTYPAPERPFIASNPAAPPRGGGAGRGTGAKRGRKPKAATAAPSTTVSRPPSQSPRPGASQPTELQWLPAPGSANAHVATAPYATSDSTTPTAGQMQQGTSPLATETGTVLSLPGVAPVAAPPPADVAIAVGAPGVAVPGEDEGEGEDELLPAMADDDYSAQLSFQSQSKDNLKVLMDNLSPSQYDRFEAYRRHALPKQAVRKVIQQTLGQQVSQPVAQIVAGFSKVFVGEVIEKARRVQERRGDTGPLSPDHLREAYRMYQQETGRVGAARPLRSKRLFVR
ncbi:Transcription initiation factor TFIID subunit 11 [Sparassis crispa]|uniref:Transcription initiation factor TFIID subunit 11 n=1 Tax=Sparassis crispa TaxID=139825 RepID=A0A401GTR0_9APHY|nr:Transcription initiation factor TFIID subunit 11 [Sparassis crispa]GBE85612.1 Transcription initiation factor TFIID subunit 11 [Sparassis crispa]